ncbi:hypothetical protein T01_6251 [Trichinella spiralis]|uniref:Uncharacterized protein n=1 Tax=Trichinella spiralis TaxID=6334 RepID=A0A0V1B9S9_TRISP|nr:hypothetical protein T01_6251 [Trichinella spiralis]
MEIQTSVNSTKIEDCQQLYDAKTIALYSCQAAQKEEYGEQRREDVAYSMKLHFLRRRYEAVLLTKCLSGYPWFLIRFCIYLNKYAITGGPDTFLVVHWTVCP